MENFKSKFIIIYANGRVWQSNNERQAIAKVDSDNHILSAYVRDNQGLYTIRYNPLDNLTEEELCETGMYTPESYKKETRTLKGKDSIFDED